MRSKSLETREDIFSQIVKAIPTAVIMVDNSGKIVLANTQTEILFGFNEEELLRTTIDKLLPERFRERHPDLIRTYIANPTKRTMGAGRDLYGLRKNGTEVSIEIGLNPLHTDEGIFVLASINDITERKKTEALVAAQESAVLASKMKSQFLANMSHEIRTPMNAVVGMADLLMQTSLNSRQSDYVETIRTSADSLLTIIEDVLDFSKIEAGKLSLKLIEFNLNDIISYTEKMFAVLAEKKGIALNTSSPLFANYFVGDPGRIRQILNNLIGNAVKFTDRGQVTLTVLYEMESDSASTIRFEIKDTGIGVSEELRPSLFQVFSQLDESTTRRHGGTGLGLSISKRLVEMMGGQIGVQSAPGKGFIFWFRLPLAVGSKLNQAQSSPPQSVPVAVENKEAQLDRLQILVAEDHQINQKLIRAMLEQLGYSVCLAENGRDAIALTKQHRFAAILMDCQMPEIDGFEATRVIRSDDALDLKKIPIIAMTASAIKGDREKCLGAGMSDYISKPIHLHDLKNILSRWTKMA